MAYINKEEIAAIRKELKAAFPDVKFSVRNRHHSTADITVVSTKGDRYGLVEVLGGEKYCGINEYYIQENFSENKAARDFLAKVNEIAHNAPGRAGGKEFYDNSDSMTDYFDVAFYVNISVGRWDKPFTVA